MEFYIQAVMNGIKKWNAITFTIDSLRVVADTAFAVVTQHLDRMALRPDNQVHQVETWVTQREACVKHGSRWLMWRVDSLRNQRRKARVRQTRTRDRHITYAGSNDAG